MLSEFFFLNEVYDLLLELSEGILNFVNWCDSKCNLTWTNKPPLLSEIFSLRGLWNPSIIDSAVRERFIGTIALSYPPIVIDDSSWKSAAESFTVALTLTLGWYESAIAPIYLSLSLQWQGYRRNHLQLLSDFQTYS